MTDVMTYQCRVDNCVFVDDDFFVNVNMTDDILR